MLNYAKLAPGTMSLLREPDVCSSKIDEASAPVRLCLLRIVARFVYLHNEHFPSAGKLWGKIVQEVAIFCKISTGRGKIKNALESPFLAISRAFC